VLGVVSEKTGYPVEVLEPGMRLDADLGIDSIKRVEILSALQERLPEAPAVAPDRLGSIRSLQDIVDLLDVPACPGATDAGPASGFDADPKPQDLGAHPAPAVQRLILKSIEAPEPVVSGRDLIRPGGDVWVLDDGAGLSAALADRLAARGFLARVVGRDEAAGVEPPTRLVGLVLLAPPSGGDDGTVRDAFRLLRASGSGLRRAGSEGGAVLASVTRLDGAFGTRGLPEPCDTTAGGLAGLVKTAAHEWPGVACKAIDVEPGLPDAAEAVARELLRATPVEIGLSRAGRLTLGLEAVPIEIGRGPKPVEPGDVVVVTGGARGVTAEVAVALAEGYRPTLVLLGRSPVPEREPEWLAGLQTEGEIKRALASRANGRATPHRIGEQFWRVAASREIVRNLGRIEAAGSAVSYRQVDVRDPEAVREALEAVRTEFGPTRGLIHGAGVLADRRIADQTDEQFDLVYDTKVGGLRALLDLLPPDDLRWLALFSSSTARFGRAGQVAYAAANEVLNKWAQREARRRPSCRVVSVNWGPWDGGMVSPSLKSVFESEGIGLIPLRDGARYLAEELRSPPGGPVEVIILGGTEVPEALKIPTAAPAPAPAPAPTDEPPPAVMTTVFERPLDLDALPILRDHVIDGRAVLPFALTLEWLAQGALQRNPGLVVCGLNSLQLHKGAVLHDNRPETLAVLVGKATRDGSVFRVPVELRGLLAEGRAVSHARGVVVLSDRHPEAERAAELPGLNSYARSARSVYHDVLFHGQELQGLEAVEALDASGVVATVRTSPAPSSWVERPLRQAWLTDPLALDCAFQLLSLWCFEQTGAASLPTRVVRYRQFRRGFPGPRVRVVARVARPSEHRATADIDFLDDVGGLVARVEGYDCVIDASLNQAFRRNRLPRPQAAPAG
jgi:NAD(P)-dependent dehydrogenase (short-subunit alcohol dehydrogenase family)